MRFFIEKKSSIKRFLTSFFIVLLVAISLVVFIVLVKKKVIYPLKYKQEICYYADKYNIDR
ncbi:MAG: hypothetical protein MJ066_04665, partial [Clostridia bacterium]|nr:hypothetical protein [Clostridia bacterium]